MRLPTFHPPLMSNPRPASKTLIATEQSEGVGARVRRSIGRPNLRSLDPFLLLDHFTVRPPAGFPSHPHRGQQTVTYMLRGAFRHTDSTGRTGTIRAGDVQWMTAGRGIVHSEMPASTGDNVGLQLWVNLPAARKLSRPAYQELRKRDIPRASGRGGNVEVAVVAGECFGVRSKVFTETPTLFWDVRMAAEDVFEERVPVEFNAFLYVIEGRVGVGEVEGEVGTCIVLGEGDSVKVESKGKARFVVIAGMPIGEPVVQHGPFVMNSQEEILQAVRDYQSGKF